MKQLTVNYSASCEVHNTSIMETISLSGDIETIEDFESSLRQLQEKVHSELASSDRYNKAKREIFHLEQDLKRMTEVYKEAQEQYQNLTGFMEAQGIKKDFPEFPPLDPKVIKALPASDEF